MSDIHHEPPLIGDETAVQRGGQPIVRLQGISRSYGVLKANDEVNLSVMTGNVHAVLGQNGAGKSTLMNILAGVIQPDSGKIFVDGEPHIFRGAADAFGVGIGMVHQHFQLIPSLTVAENLLLNDEPRRWGLVDRNRAQDTALAALEALGAPIDPRRLVGTLSVAARQRVEIARVLRRRVRVLVLDEPTAVLAPAEAEDLMQLVRRLASGGTAVVLISHKLDEVLRVADHVTILRAGRVVANQSAAGLRAPELARIMVGRKVEMTTNATGPTGSHRVLLSIQDASTKPASLGPALRGVRLEVSTGELHGIAGVDGNGQHELVSVITGSMPLSSGTMRWDGLPMVDCTIRKQIDRGIAHIPEDRHEQGLFLAEDIAVNLVMRRFSDRPRSRLGVLRRGFMRSLAKRRIEEFEIQGRPEQLTGELSGGNQQKVVVARELGENARLVVAEQPTRGVDVASAQFIYAQLLKQRDDGKAVLVVSVDLDELLNIADRISVMYGGQIVGTWSRPEFNVAVIAECMTGAAMSTERPGNA